MKFYQLPNDEQFYKDFEQDLRNAEEVVIVSPYLSANIITYWRSLHRDSNKESFTIVYDIGDELEGRKSGLEGRPSDQFSRITWRFCNRLHTKFYYFRFQDGFAFYHGSANFTNFGLGKSVATENRNKEFMTRITNEEFANEMEVLLTHYLSYEEVEPIYNNSSGEWEPQTKITDNGIIKEYDDILSRLDEEVKYFRLESSIILNGFQNPSKYVSGAYRTTNGYKIKIHTTNDVSKPSFTFSKQELKWFLGDFRKSNCLKTRRGLVLVIKEQGRWQGKLTVLYVEPKQLFSLLATSTQSKKIHINKHLLSINIREENNQYYISRYSKSIPVRVKRLESMEEEQSGQ